MLLTLVGDLNVMLLERNPVTFTGVFQCFNVPSRLQVFVNTLMEEMQRADDGNIVEYSDGKLETEQKPELAVSLSTAKSKPGQEDKKNKYFSFSSLKKEISL